MTSTFFSCYLLVSVSEEAGKKGKTYIGFTTHPPRRLRQHNGELQAGAKRTKSIRPCEMVVVLHGFSSQVAALQFEWAWQHPDSSKVVRVAAAAIAPKDKRGMRGKLRLLFTMLNLQPWAELPLEVLFLSSKHDPARAGLPQPPSHMPVSVGSFADLPASMGRGANCSTSASLRSGLHGSASASEAPGEAEEVTGGYASPAEDTDEESPERPSGSGLQEASDHDDAGLSDDEAVIDLRAAPEQARARAARGPASRGQGPPPETSTSGGGCTLCAARLTARRVVCPCCGAVSHAICLAERLLAVAPDGLATLLPARGACPRCHRQIVWNDAVTAGQAAASSSHRAPLAPLTLGQLPSMPRDGAFAGGLLDGRGQCGRLPRVSGANRPIARAPARGVDVDVIVIDDD